jgi:hypothetical protein
MQPTFFSFPWQQLFFDFTSEQFPVNETSSANFFFCFDRNVTKDSSASWPEGQNKLNHLGVDSAKNLPVCEYQFKSFCKSELSSSWSCYREHKAFLKARRCLMINNTLNRKLTFGEAVYNCS